MQIIHRSRLVKIWTGNKEFGSILEQMEEIGELPFCAAIEMNYDSQYPVPTLVPANKYGFVPQQMRNWPRWRNSLASNS